MWDRGYHRCRALNLVPCCGARWRLVRPRSRASRVPLLWLPARPPTLRGGRVGTLRRSSGWRAVAARQGAGPTASDGTGPDFWAEVGGTFRRSRARTAHYRAAEERLLAWFFPPLVGQRLLKTDLWDEAKNTEMLRWAAERGARPVGLDVSPPVVRDVRKVLGGRRPALVIADVRSIPLRSGSCDLVYSMGTIEHFPDYPVAVREILRVLRPGGTAIVGMPNRLDPFLRPLLVQCLNRVGHYGYRMEKSFTPPALQRVLEEGGLPGHRRHRAPVHARRSPDAGSVGVHASSGRSRVSRAPSSGPSGGWRIACRPSVVMGT